MGRTKQTPKASKKVAKVKKTIKKAPKAKEVAKADSPVKKVAAKKVAKPAAAKPKAAKAAAKPKAPKTSGGGKHGVYTDAQYEKYLEYKGELSGKTDKDLKALLRQNDQKIGGKKPELVDRIADAKVLGKIPRCPNCSGGRPTFNHSTGIYHCVGFQDDDKFRWCQKKFTMSEITRESWTD